MSAVDWSEAIASLKSEAPKPKPWSAELPAGSTRLAEERGGSITGPTMQGHVARPKQRGRHTSRAPLPCWIASPRGTRPQATQGRAVTKQRELLSGLSGQAASVSWHCDRTA
jgi:hypothetical protein